ARWRSRSHSRHLPKADRHPCPRLHATAQCPGYPKGFSNYQYYCYARLAAHIRGNAVLQLFCNTRGNADVTGDFRDRATGHLGVLQRRPRAAATHSSAGENRLRYEVTTCGVELMQPLTLEVAPAVQQELEITVSSVSPNAAATAPRASGISGRRRRESRLRC